MNKFINHHIKVIEFLKKNNIPYTEYNGGTDRDNKIEKFISIDLKFMTDKQMYQLKKLTRDV